MAICIQTPSLRLRGCHERAMSDRQKRHQLVPVLGKHRASEPLYISVKQFFCRWCAEEGLGASEHVRAVREVVSLSPS